MELETQLEVVRKRIQELEVGFSRTDAVQGGDELSDLESEDRSLEFGSPRKDRRLDSPLSLGSSVSEASSLRSKLTESLKALSPEFSPGRRRLARTLQAAAKGSCLDQEVSVSGEEWLSFKLDRENDEPRSLKVGEREGGKRPPEASRPLGRHAEKDARAKRHGVVSAPGPAAMHISKKELIGASRKEGSAGNALEEFRESLKALEQLEKKETPVKEYSNQKMEETVQESKAGPRVESGKLEDVNAVRSFISSGWSLLNAEAKCNEGSTSNVTAEQSTEGVRLKKEVDCARRVTAAVLSSRNAEKIVDERYEKSEGGSKVLSDNMLARCTGLSDGGTKQAKQQGHSGVGEEHRSDIAGLKEEQGCRFNVVMVDEKQQFEQVAKMVEKRAEELVAKRINPLLTGAENVLSDMKRELVRVREDNQNLQKARESMHKERQAFKRECEVMQVELHNLRDDVEVFQKENDMKVEKCYQRVAKLLKEEADIKAQLEDLRNLHREERECRKKASDEEGRLASSALVEALAKEQEHIAGRFLVGEREKAVIMDRVEHLSQLYLGGLEDVRAEVTRLKRSAVASPSLGGKPLLADMRSRREKCLQLETAMKDAVEEAVKLRDKYTVDLEKAKEKWSWTMNLQAGEVNVILGNLKASLIELTGRLEGAESALHARIQRVEEQLLTTSKQATASDDGLVLANVEKHQGVMGKELRRLDEQMQGMVEKLEQARHCFDEDKIVSLRQDVDTLGQKVRDATKSRTLIMDKMSEMGRKIRKLEGAQLDLVRSVEEVRACSKDLEKSVTSLYPKYETTTSRLKGMDARLVTAEDSLKEIRKSLYPKYETTTSRLKGMDARLVTAEDSLKEIRKSDSNCGRDNKQVGKPLFGGSTCEVDVQLLHTRVETLEGRVEHVASATFTNLRILDSKVEHYRVGVQSAVEGAAMAESKCGVLGAEIVKVFRTLASRNEARDSNSKPARRSCRYCRKLSREAGADGEAENNHLTALEASQAQEIESQAEAAVRRNKTKGTEKLTFIESYAESFYESGRDFKKSMSRSIGQQRPAAGKTSKRKDNSNNSTTKNKADTRTPNVQT